MQKCDFFQFKMAVILWNLEQLGPNFALHSGTTQDMCLQNIIRISLKLRVLGLAQKFKNILDPPTAAGAASNLSNTYIMWDLIRNRVRQFAE